EDGIRDYKVTGVQTCALPILTVCCIAGHPQYYIHHMGLGEPIGYGIRVTMNDTTLYQDTTNEFSRAVYIALMGDPTLRMEPVARSEERRVGKEWRSRGSG